MNKETLNKKSIYELRMIGRDLGVKSPTALKKQQLIDSILERNLNLIEPHSSKRGRPPLQATLNSQTFLQNDAILENLRLKILNQVEKVIENAKLEISKIITDNLLK